MIATYESRADGSLLSVEALLLVEEDAVATAAGLVLRIGASDPAPETPEDEEQIRAHRAKIMAQLMEYGIITQFASMLAFYGQGSLEQIA